MLKFTPIKLALYIIIFSIKGFSQDNTVNIVDVNKITIDEGLTNLRISSIVKDDLGYIWIGTYKGLNRYDGDNITQFHHNESYNSLYSENIRKIYKANNGNIFISTSEGMNLFDIDKNKMHRIKPSNGIYYDFIDYNNKTYGANLLGGLFVFNSKEKSSNRISEFSNDIIIDNLTLWNNTGIWSKTVDDRYIINYDPKRNSLRKFYIPDNDQISRNRKMILIDDYLIIINDNLTAFNLNKLEFSSLPEKINKLNEIKNYDINFIKYTEDNTIWIGTKYQGVFIYEIESNTIIHLEKKYTQINSKDITSFYKYRNQIFLGTFDYGVNVLRQKKNIHKFNFNRRLNEITKDKFITCIDKDEAGNYYMGTRNEGLIVYNLKTKAESYYRDNNDYNTNINNHIRTMLIDSKDRLWLASEAEFRLVDLKTLKSKEINITKPNNGVVSICKQHGKYFAGTDMQGFFIINDEGTIEDQVISLGNNITRIIPFGDDKLIISSYMNGLFLYDIDKGSFVPMINKELQKDLLLNSIITLNLDKDSTLWIGSFNNGLYKYNIKNGDLKTFTESNGLINNDVVGIIEDNEQNLWLSTSNGLSKFDKDSTFVNFDKNDGLNNVQFHEKATLINKDGTIFLGGNYGLTYFNPSDIKKVKSKTTSKPILKSLSVLNKTITPNDSTGILKHIINNTEQIILEKEQNALSFEFHSFNYLSTSKINFAYKLEGNQSKWVFAGNKNYAYYSNLPSGDYVFKVKAKDGNNNWSAPTTIKIKVKQSILLSNTAYIIYILISFVISIFIYKAIKGVHKKKKELFEEIILEEETNEIKKNKTKQFAHTSNEIITVLTVLKGRVDILFKESDLEKDNKSSINALRNNTERLQNLVNKLLRGDKDKIKNIDISEDINTTDKTDSKHDNSEKPTILLVENNKELSDFITETIEDKFNVITAFNGEDGLRIARDLIPDLIISDIESSETDNVHMWTLIKNDELISHIPIILLSTNIDAESKIESYKQGIDAYISKPFDIEILPARINNLITQRRSLSTDEITENTHPFSAKIVDVINAEYHLTELNVNYLANSMSMSRTNFYRKFIDNFDVSPKDYITKFRINKAIELIENGNENMGNISFMCGFASQSNFSVSFKREKGVTPLKYKKRLTGN